MLLAKFNNAIKQLEHYSKKNIKKELELTFSLPPTKEIKDIGYTICTKYLPEDLHVFITIEATQSNSIIFVYKTKDLTIDENGNVYLNYIINEKLISKVYRNTENTELLENIIDDFLNI